MTKVAASRVRVTTFKRVAKSRKPVVVQLDGKDCAVIMPIEEVQPRKTKEKRGRRRGTTKNRRARSSEAPALPKDDPTGWKAIDRLIGAGKAVAPDVSERHDDYLYGHLRD